MSKYRWIWCIQGNYGFGWEVVCPCEDYEEAKMQLSRYNDNEAYPHRIKKVRIKH